jgi:hypothetical protein
MSEPGGRVLVSAAIELAFALMWTNEETIELEGVLTDADVAGLVKSTAALRVGHGHIQAHTSRPNPGSRRLSIEHVMMA